MTTPSFRTGSPVTYRYPVEVMPDAVTITVHDEAGVILGTVEAKLPDAAPGHIEAVIPGDLNALPTGVRKGARQIEVVIDTSEGREVDSWHYLVIGAAQLTVLKNTFQTYPEALMVRSDLPRLDGWDSANDSDRMSALMIAHASMCNMAYRYRVGAHGAQRRLTDFPGATEDQHGRLYAKVTDIRNTLSWEWAEMPSDFKEALKRAQITEADGMLSGDPVGDKRRSGIVTETIGESSMTLRDIPEVQTVISRAAMAHLRGYVMNGVSISRA